MPLIIVAGVIATVLLISYAAWRAVSGVQADTSVPSSGTVPAVIQLLSTRPASQDGAVVFPESMTTQLTEIGKVHGKVVLHYFDGDGTAGGQVVDLTPRVDDKPNGEVLRIDSRINTAIAKKMAQIQDMINTPATVGGRSLYRGLLHTTIPADADVWITSSGIDTADPLDFRDLAWDTAPARVVSELRESGELPRLPGARVLFLLLPLAGEQPQLRLAQQDYLKAVWTAILKAAGATSVEFIEAPPAGTIGGTVTAPAVPIPALPDTVGPEKTTDGYTCTLGANSYFRVDSPELTDPAEAKVTLTKCIRAAGPNAKVEIDGWTAYKGTLKKDGTPAVNPASSIKLSQERCDRIAKLLIDLGVNPSFIVRIKGHGNKGHPDPKHPRSAKNRVVKVHFITEGR